MLYVKQQLGTLGALATGGFSSRIGKRLGAVLLAGWVSAATATTAWASSLEFCWSGGVTDSSVVAVAKTSDHGSSHKLQLLISKVEGDFSDPYYVSSEITVDSASNWVGKISASGLAAHTQYYYAFKVDGEVETEKQGSFKTFVEAGKPMDFSIAFGSCANNGAIANGPDGEYFSFHDDPLYTAIANQNPLFYLSTGDLHYSDIKSSGEVARAAFRTAFDRVLHAPAEAALYRKVPFAYMWDDHDYGPNDSDASSPGRTQARETYQEYVPHYPLASGSGDVPIYQSFDVGRVRFILLDLRSEQTASQMMSETQLNWLEEQLVDAQESGIPAKVIVSTMPWLGKEKSGDDRWTGPGHTEQREDVVNMIQENGITGIALLSGDAHMVAIDDGIIGDHDGIDGTKNDYATSGGTSFPVFHAGPLARKSASVKGGPYNRGNSGVKKQISYPKGKGQFGLLSVKDNGDTIDVTFTGMRGDGDGNANVATTPDGVDLTYTFTAPSIDVAPTLASISPDTCVVTGGTEVTLTGEDFTSGSVVKFDGVAATDVVVVSSTEITCKTPANPEGSVDVSVHSGAFNDTLENGFTYIVGNNAPVATADSYVTVNDLSIQVEANGVLENDSDADGDAITAVLVSDVSNGELALNANGSFIYHPDAEFTGADSFTYQANDGSADSAVATVTITVNQNYAANSYFDEAFASSNAYTLSNKHIGTGWYGARQRWDVNTDDQVAQASAISHRGALGQVISAAGLSGSYHFKVKVKTEDAGTAHKTKIRAQVYAINGPFRFYNHRSQVPKSSGEGFSYVTLSDEIIANGDSFDWTTFTETVELGAGGYDYIGVRLLAEGVRPFAGDKVEVDEILLVPNGQPDSATILDNSFFDENLTKGRNTMKEVDVDQGWYYGSGLWKHDSANGTAEVKKLTLTGGLGQILDVNGVSGKHELSFLLRNLEGDAKANQIRLQVYGINGDFKFRMHNDKAPSSGGGGFSSTTLVDEVIVEGEDLNWTEMVSEVDLGSGYEYLAIRIYLKNVEPDAGDVVEVDEVLFY